MILIDRKSAAFANGTLEWMRRETEFMDRNAKRMKAGRRSVRWESLEKAREWWMEDASEMKEGKERVGRRKMRKCSRTREFQNEKRQGKEGGGKQRQRIVYFVHGCWRRMARKSRGMRDKEKAHHRACWKETLSAERREFAGVSPDRVDLSPERVTDL